MNKWSRLPVLAVAVTALCAATTTSSAQSKPVKGTKSARSTKPGGGNSKANTAYDAAATHGQLVMAYRDNLVMFTKMVRGLGSVTDPVNVVLARPAMKEMRHSYDELMKHHDAQLEELSGKMDGPATATSTQRDARLGRIGQQIKLLDLVVNDPTPDPKEVATRAAEILKECAALHTASRQSHPLTFPSMRIVARSALLVAALASVAQAQQRVDVLITGGSVIDGTGAPARRADVGILGDKIFFIGNAAAARVTGARTIDAKGLIVAPGFIDPHTHSAGELSSPTKKANLNYLMQGVTTVITNNDGGGGVNIARQLGTWETQGIGTNAAVYIGQGSVRGAVMGMSGDKPTPAQMDSMKALVARGMDDGAIGMSTGLYYAPGSYSSTEEVIELAKVAAAKGGRYDSHIRDESSYTVGLVGAVAEVIRIGREARMPVHISHIKALGVDVWGQSDTIIKMMKRARADGVAITASQYPYTASGTGVGASLLPRWAEIGGRDSLAWRIKDPATHAKLVTEMTENMRRRGGANTLLITGGRDSTVKGKRLDAVARMWSTTPVEAAMRIILNGDASVASFNMDEKDIVAFMVQDFISTDSDGSDGHPRKYGTFPKIFHEYVAQKHVLTLPQAVHRSSQASAQMMGIKGRGELTLSSFADVIVFDAATFADRATYEEPTLLAVGMKYVVVNGVVTIDGEKYTGVTAGRVLKRQ